MAVKNPLKSFKEKNVAETLSETAHSVTSVARDELNQEWRTALAQLLEVKKNSHEQTQNINELSGDLEEGQEISFKKAKESHAEGDQEIEYERKILRYHEESVQIEASETNQKLEEIRVELKKITQQSKELESQFKEASNEILMKTQKPGKYHENFVEWLFSQVKQVSARLESSLWATSVANKAIKKGFWDNAKAYGTSYSLSAERYMVQQTG